VEASAVHHIVDDDVEWSAPIAAVLGRRNGFADPLRGP
jgi:hypothetical protein